MCFTLNGDAVTSAGRQLPALPVGAHFECPVAPKYLYYQSFQSHRTWSGFRGLYGEDFYAGPDFLWTKPGWFKINDFEEWKAALEARGFRIVQSDLGIQLETFDNIPEKILTRLL